MPPTQDTEAVDTLLQRLIDWHTPPSPLLENLGRSAAPGARGSLTATIDDRDLASAQ
jgi:hypothetical protein